MKKVFVGLLAAFILIGAQFVGGTNVVSAHPNIKLDYGESYMGDSVYWWVDKGSLIAGGTVSHPTLRIMVTKESDREVFLGRKYTFTERNGVWKYYYEAWNGKGTYLGNTTWHDVSGDQLANDILYIAISH